MPHRLEQGKRVVGLKQTTQVVKENRAEVVYVAKDADERLTGPLMELCRQKNVEIVMVETMKERVYCADRGRSFTAAIYDGKEG